MGEFWTAVGSAGALVAAVAACFAGYFTFRIMQAGQKQVEVSQEQFRQSVEAERDAHLPVLVPDKPLFSVSHAVSDGYGHEKQPRQEGYNREWPFAKVAIRNAGSGIALNIEGVVFEAEPEYEVLKTTGQHHSHSYAMPISPGEECEVDWTVGGFPNSGDTEIGTVTRYKLYAPRKPTYTESQRGETDKVARLTLTYSDIFGRKHAAIYDFTAQGQWENVAYLRNIAQDLGDLGRDFLSHAPVYSAPEILTAPS